MLVFIRLSKFISRLSHFLFLRFIQQPNTEARKNNIGNPNTHDGREFPIGGESFGKLAKDNVKASQCKAHCQMEAHAPSHLTRGDGSPYKGKYKYHYAISGAAV